VNFPLPGVSPGPGLPPAARLTELRSPIGESTHLPFFGSGRAGREGTPTRRMRVGFKGIAIRLIPFCRPTPASRESSPARRCATLFPGGRAMSWRRFAAPCLDGGPDRISPHSVIPTEGAKRRSGGISSSGSSGFIRRLYPPFALRDAAISSPLTPYPSLFLRRLWGENRLFRPSTEPRFNKLGGLVGVKAITPPLQVAVSEGVVHSATISLQCGESSARIGPRQYRSCHGPFSDVDCH